MIYTVTTNPALDYLMYPDSLSLGSINRSSHEKIFVGGKGINVSIVLSRLGVRNTALGFCAGFVGDEICRRIEAEGVLCDFIKTEGQSRINIKLIADKETAINGAGPIVSVADEKKLLSRLAHADEGDIVIISGSPARSESGRLTENILDAAKNAQIVADMEGDALLASLSYKPLLIKPNLDELMDIFSVRDMTNDEIISSAHELKRRGARNVLVSCGGNGAILVAEDGKVYCSGAPSGKVVSTVGAGDSMIAGFISGLPFGYARALEIGVAAGSATAFSSELASADELSFHINNGKN